MRALAVALAGGLGAVCRYGLGAAIGVQSFPWVTLAINVVGSFALGALLSATPSWLAEPVRTTLAVGFLGAFTTFSTFGYESQAMLRAGRHTAALAYVALSVVLGIGAAAAGVAAVRALD